MSATNSTPNYGLPQYVADDKPTYLGDFNKAMLDIDTNMKSIDNKAEGAESGIASVTATANQALENANTANTKATTAQATAEQAQTKATTAQATAEQAQTKATTAQETAEQAQTTATSANQTATESKELAQTVKNTVDNIPGWALTDNIALPTINGSASTGKISCNYSERLKLLNIYGKLDFNGNQGKCIFAKLPNNITRPSSERTLARALYDAINDIELTCYIDTEGNLYLNNGSAINRGILINLMLCTNGWN